MVSGKTSPVRILDQWDRESRFLRQGRPSSRRYDCKERKAPFYFILKLDMFYEKKENGTRIVASSKSEVARTARALKLVKRYQGEEFSQADNLAAVLVYPKRDYDNELFVKKKIWICQSGTVQESSPEYLASLLVHEMSHLAQYRQRKKYFGAVAENRAYKAQRKFLTQINDTRSIQWLNRQYKKRWWLYKPKSGGPTPIFPSHFLFRKFLKKYELKKMTIKIITKKSSSRRGFYRKTANLPFLKI